MKKIFLFAVIATLSINSVYAKLLNNKTALLLLNEVYAQHKISPLKNYLITGNGLHRNDDHLPRPDILNEYAYSFSIKTDVDNNQYDYQQVFTKKNTDVEQHYKSTYKNDQEYSLNNNSQEYIKTHPNNNAANVLRFAYLNPSTLLAYLIRHIHEASIIKTESEDTFIYKFEFENQEQWQLEISKSSLLCKSFSRKYFHYLYGDVIESISWSNYINSPLGNFAREVMIKNNNYTSYHYTQELQLLSDQHSINILDSNLKTAKEKIQKDRIIDVNNIEFNVISNNLYEILLEETNNRLIVAEFQNFIILLEGSYHSKNGDMIIEYLKQKFPDKPIKYSSYSHGHKQYLGFSRSFVANNTTIVTTQSNQNFIKKISDNDFSLRPDQQGKSKFNPRFEVLNNNRWSIKDKLNELYIYNINSNHTDDYLVFYFPMQKLLFVGDLLWVKDNGDKTVELSGRSANFYNEVINKLKLEVDRFYISWPIKGYQIKTVIDFNLILIL